MPTRLPLTTTRLLIRPIEEGDLHAVVSYRTDPDTALLQTWSPGWSLDDARRLLGPPGVTLPEKPGDWVQLGIVGPDAALCGDIWTSLDDTQPDTFELGITLAATARGNGYATEALGAVADALFANGAHRVFTRSDARNSRLHQLVERLGMRREAELVDADWFKGEWTTLVIHAVLAGEWRRPTEDGGPGSAGDDPDIDQHDGPTDA